MSYDIIGFGRDGAGDPGFLRDTSDLGRDRAKAPSFEPEIAGYFRAMIPSLPSLPPLPGEDDEYYHRPAGRSIIAVLSDEHQQLTELSAELARTAQPPRELADVVIAAVARHLSAEEQYLYPAVKQLLPEVRHLCEREIERDTQILRQLALLESVPTESQAFNELATAIDSDLHHHREICAAEIFPILREKASEGDLIQLGNRVEVAEEAAPTRPHPDSPATPPWNKVADPALGVVDKIRDVVGRRKTYVEDL